MNSSIRRDFPTRRRTRTISEFSTTTDRGSLRQSLVSAIRSAASPGVWADAVAMTFGVLRGRALHRVVRESGGVPLAVATLTVGGAVLAADSLRTELRPGAPIVAAKVGQRGNCAVLLTGLATVEGNDLLDDVLAALDLRHDVESAMRAVSDVLLWACSPLLPHVPELLAVNDSLWDVVLAVQTRHGRWQYARLRGFRGTDDFAFETQMLQPRADEVLTVVLGAWHPELGRLDSAYAEGYADMVFTARAVRMPAPPPPQALPVTDVVAAVAAELDAAIATEELARRPVGWPARVKCAPRPAPGGQIRDRGYRGTDRPYPNVSGTTWGLDALGQQIPRCTDGHGGPAGTVSGGCAGPGFRHDALFYDSVEELADLAAPFLLEGLAAGDGAVIAAGPAVTAALHDAVENHSLVLVLERHALYRSRTPTAITTFRGLGEQAGPGRRVRVVGEVDFGTTAADWTEWQRYEAVINAAFASSPLWGLCVFSTALPEPLLTAARRTHPQLVSRDGRATNADYVDPATYLAGLSVPDEPLERTPPALVADDVTDFIGLRRTIRRHLSNLAGPADLLEDFQLAVDEMTSNAVRHGHRPVSLRLWTAPGQLVCTIGDAGTGPADPFAGYGPAHGEDLSAGGMGLWLARQLCDHVALRRDAHGSSVRLTTRWV
ncbi:anti-sigma factor RsbA family regulatory protein [Blastococcus sp. SYSU DS0541]